jgi:hypothetical protein
MNTNVIKKLALGVAVSGLCAWQAGAVGGWVAYSSLDYAHGNVDNPVIGNEFTVSASGPLTINELGAYDEYSTGFGADIVKVAIYNAAGAIVSPIASFTGNPTRVGLYTYQGISPITLAAGQTYYVAATGYGAADVNFYNTTINSTKGLTEVESFYGNGSLGSTLAIGGLSEFTPTALGAGTFGLVPEATDFALAGVALLGLVYFGRRYAQNLKLA